MITHVVSQKYTRISDKSFLYWQSCEMCNEIAAKHRLHMYTTTMDSVPGWQDDSHCENTYTSENGTVSEMTEKKSAPVW